MNAFTKHGVKRIKIKIEKNFFFGCVVRWKEKMPKTEEKVFLLFLFNLVGIVVGAYCTFQLGWCCVCYFIEHIINIISIILWDFFYWKEKYFLFYMFYILPMAVGLRFFNFLASDTKPKHLHSLCRWKKCVNILHFTWNFKMFLNIFFMNTSLLCINFSSNFKFFYALWKDVFT